MHSATKILTLALLIATLLPAADKKLPIEETTNDQLTISAGWVPANNTNQLTNAKGQSVDSPFGSCDPGPDTMKLTHQYAVIYNGLQYALTPILNVVAQDGLGTLTVFSQIYTFTVSR